MIKNKGNFQEAISTLKKDDNNAVLHIFEKKNINDGPLKGATFTIKDVYATKEIKTQSSSLSLKDFYPSYDATVIEKLIAAGASPVAKVHNDELALGGEGIYSHWGVIANPLDKSRKVGGSSSGNAATLLDSITFALGSDTGDSVRLPASFIGKVGFKPSYGAVSRYGLFPYSPSLDTVAWFAHNVNDVYQVAKVLYGIDKKDFTSVEVKIDNVKETKPNKIGYFKVDNLVHNEVNESYKKVIEKIKENDIQVEEIIPNTMLLEAIKPVYDIISYSEAASNLSNINGIAFGNRQDGQDWSEIMTNTRSHGFGKMVQRRLILGSFFLNKENQEELFLRAQKIRRLIIDYLNDLHSKYDVVIYPSSYFIAPKFDEKSSDSFMEFILTGANLAGNPSINIKMGESINEKMPFNLTIDAKIYEDQKLLSYALWIEKLLGEK